MQAQEPPCAGTVLQLSINETGPLSIDRFCFHLLLNGEGDREEAAMDQLNQRLSTLRLQLNPPGIRDAHGFFAHHIPSEQPCARVR